MAEGSGEAFTRDSVLVGNPGWSWVTLPDDESSSRSAIGAIRLGLIHLSYLHQHRGQLPAVTPGILKAFEALGTAWFNRELAVHLYLNRNYSSVGDLSSDHAMVRRTFHPWLYELPGFRSSILLGRGESVESLSKRVTADVMSQILGSLVHFRSDEIARTIVHDFFSEFLPKGGEIGDPISVLSKIVPPQELTWSYAKHGPDHSPTFTAHMVDRQKRTATGTATSKSAARAAAIRNFLTKHDLVSEAETKQQFALPGPIRVAELTKRRVNDTLNAFEISEAWRPLVTQAFIHKSWAFENRHALQIAGQLDNQVLSLVGSYVAEFEYSYSVVRAALPQKPEKYSHQTQSNSNLAQASKALGIDRALLLGKGQQTSGLQLEMTAATMQAVIAALYISKASPTALFSVLPISWEPARKFLTPDRPRDADARTTLQQLLVGAGLDTEYRISEQHGADHQREFIADLVLTSPDLNESIIVHSRRSHSAKAAFDDAASRMLAAIDRVTDAGHPGNAAATPAENFLRRHLATRKPTTSASEHANLSGDKERIDPEIPPDEPAPVRQSPLRDLNELIANSALSTSRSKTTEVEPPSSARSGDETSGMGVEPVPPRDSNANESPISYECSLRLIEFDASQWGDHPSFLIWRSHRFPTHVRRMWADPSARARAAGDLARAIKFQITHLINTHGHFLYDSGCALDAFHRECSQLISRSTSRTQSVEQDLRSVATAVHTMLPLALTHESPNNEALNALCRLLTRSLHDAEKRARSPRKRTNATVEHAIDNFRDFRQEVLKLRGMPEPRWLLFRENSLRQFSDLYFGRFDCLVSNTPESATAQPEHAKAQQARLTFAVLPDGTTTRAFVTERRKWHRRENPRSRIEFDEERTNILDELVARYGSPRCTLYRGYSSTSQVVETGENINEDYLILVIGRPKGEDAVAISPAAGRHATYVVRHDVSTRPWHEVFGFPKNDAKAMGAHRLVFRERPPLNEYQAMREKIVALLSCSSSAFHGRLIYLPARRNYELRL